jgi:transcriptional regulator with XRE-family HTH domain
LLARVKGESPNMTIERDDVASGQPPDETASLGARLRAARKRACLSQEQASRAIGSTERSIGRWESNEAAPSFEDVSKLAKLYDVALDWLGGRTTITAVFRPGRVIVDEAAQEIMQRLVAAKASLRDVPAELIRHPGIDYAFRVPERCLLLSIEAAQAVDRQIQRMVAMLRGNQR